MERRKKRALAWTAAQYVLLTILLFGGKVLVVSIAGWSLIGLAVGITGWSLAAFRTTRLSITPLVPEGGRMILSGPYRWIRHPMYASVLLASMGTLFLDPTPMRVGAFILLLPAMVGKLSVEEELLRYAYPGYAEYSLGTKRLIPGVW